MSLRPALIAALASLLLISTVSAAGPIQVQINSIQETPGRITAVVTAFGGDGRALAALTGPSIKASLDGQPLNVSAVQSTSAGDNSMGIVLLVDVSGSMAGDSLNQARTALSEFSKSLNPGDSVALYSFDAKVHLLQDFTTNRTVMSQAIGKLQATGDTALYDAVGEGAKKIGASSYARKLVIILTDGEATVGKDQRASSLDIARQTGVPFVAVGLGREIDRGYLEELTAASGGRLLVASTAGTLRATYANIADSIKAQYTISIAVPADVDRSIPATLAIQISLGADSGSAERAMPPRAGARPPSFVVGVDGLSTNQKVSATTTLTPAIGEGIVPVSATYTLDGQTVATVTDPPFVFTIDPSAVGNGNHVIKVVLTDARGRVGEWQTAFSVSAAGAKGGPSLPIAPIAGAMAVLVLGALGFRRLRRPRPMSYESRIKPWNGRVLKPGEAPPEFQKQERLAPPPVRENPVLGLVIVIDESYNDSGSLLPVREYEIGTSPLTLGVSPSCDIVLIDPEGRMGNEEARLWVQKGRLVYHKLTTLSAMATEGVTSGWVFLDTSEEMQIGTYRIAFRAQVPEETEYDAPRPQAESSRLREIWPRSPGDPERFTPSPSVDY